MRIEVVGDGHVFQGTPQQILMQMKSLAFGAEHMSMREYIEGNVANIARGLAVDLLTDWTRSRRGPVYLSYDGNTGAVAAHPRLAYTPRGECPHFPTSDVGEPTFTPL